MQVASLQVTLLENGDAGMPDVVFVHPSSVIFVFHTGPFDPNDPNGAPPQPPSAWQHMLHVVGGIMHFFGRLSFLVDENAHAVHFFVSALLQLLDR